MNEFQERMLDRRLARDPIAIVGLSGLFPKSQNVREFWANVVTAADCTTEVPAGHWDVDEFYDPDPSVPDKTYAKRGGFIPDVPFNPLEFGLPPNTLEVTDVLQLLSLTVTRDVLKDAGADQGWYDPKRTGVVLGITGANQLTQPLTARLQSPVLKEVIRSCGLSERDAEEIAAKFRMAYAPWEENSFPGMLGNVVAGRIANRFDLGGINMTIDAACASSLGAVRTAVSELLEGRADTMLTGGCDAENTIFMYLCFSKTPALSKSGRIRPFDSEADGTLIGEGIGMLALRRLADAERDGNQVYAVIRGLGTSSDGRFKSIYAPRKEGQMEALRRAYQDADAAPDSIELFEAHGTGTAVGDATELSALTEVVAKDGGERGYAAIGSVKSQIGHTKAAAGAAAMIKLAFALHHKVLPPTINVDRPSAAFGTDGPFYVNTKARPWIRDPKRPQRRAALSAFGFGGTNFHAVLQEHGDGDDLEVRFPVARVHLWHAAGPEALADALTAKTPPTGGPVPAAHARVAFVARDEAEADALRELALGELRARTDRDEWSHPKGVHYRRSAADTGRVAALFAGQGSQYVDPGLSAVLALPPLRSSFDRANQHFREDTPLSRVAFPPPLVDDEGRAAQEAALRATAYAQPAIGALSAGQFRYLTELGFEAEGFLGHSFGELTALYAAGAYDEDTLHQLARARGRAMSPASGQAAEDTGAMAAVFAPEERVAELLAEREGLRVCNRNAPDQIVIGGATVEVDRLVEAASLAGVRARRLPVSAAFHTSFVAHAVDDFRTVVDTVDIGVPRGRVYANSPGAAYGTDPVDNRRVLAEQLINPVEFAARVEEMYADGFRVFVEFGPNSVLTGLVGRILGDRPHSALALDGGPGKDADLTLKQSVARLAVLGLPVAVTDRYAAAVEKPVPTKGMTLMLNGINYVSPERRAAYQNALSNGYRVPAAVAPPAAAAPPVVPAARGAEPVVRAEPPAPSLPQAAPVRATEQPLPEPTRAVPTVTGTAAGNVRIPPDTLPPAQENEHMPSDRFTELVSDHLSLHDEYLNGQLQSVERLTRILERAADQGQLDQVLPGVSSVKEHGLAIGRTHAHANDVLRQLAHLEMGGAATAAPAPSAPAPRPAVQAPALPEPPVLPALPPGWTPPVPVPAPESAAAPVSEVAPAPAQEPASAPEPAPAAAAAVPASAGVDVETVRSVLLEVVAQKTGYPAEMLELDMGVESDLGIDSIKRVEIMGVIQERFGVVSSAGPEQLAELRTLGDIVDFVAGPTGNTATEAAPAATSADPAPAASADPAPAASPQASEALSPILRAHAALVTLPAADPLLDAHPADQGALVVDDGSELAARIVERLTATGRQVHVLRLPGVPARLSGVHDYALTGWGTTELAACVEAVFTSRIGLVVDVTARTDSDWNDGVRRLAHSLLLARHVVRPLTDMAAHGRAAFLAVTRLDGAFGLTGVAEEAAPAGGVAGLVKTLALEEPELFCRSVDLTPGIDPADAAALVLDEAADSAVEPVQVGHDGTRRVGLAVAGEPLTAADAASLTADDLLVVTGGARGITADCVVELARRHQPRLLLLGRTPLDEEPAWAQGLPEENLKAAAAASLTAAGEKPTPRRVGQLAAAVAGAREIRATLDALRAAGSRAEYLPVDITDQAATAAALARYKDEVTGVVHGAGVLADQMIAQKKASEIERVFAPKLTGLRSVMAALGGTHLRHVMLFSSVAGFFGNQGQSDYAMANEVLNAWASSRRRTFPHTRVTSINWGAWDSGMVSPQIRKVFEERGIALIPVAEGARMFADQFAPERAGDVVTVLGPTTPLSSRDRSGAAAGGTVTRCLSDLAGSSLVTDHVIDATPVLPAVVAMGWALGAVEHADGRRAVRLRDFAVHRGIVFDGTQPAECRLVMTPVDGDGGGEVKVATQSLVDDTVRPHYAATVVAGALPPAAPVTGLPAPGTGTDAAGLYADGTLFHGPALRGLRRILADSESRLVLECEAVRTDTDSGSSDWFAAGSADLLLQAALVWVRRFRGTAGLPLAVGGVELYGPLTAGEVFLVVVEPVGQGGPDSRLDITACTPDGQVRARFTAVSVVSAPQLAAKFTG
ncbi:type I polyketide synthase [Streptomyces colonosanans]|uniref:Type I polyketide synthase n=1 Tax=Streptomyces colonosanans TaxID=1428652 RepID=A0A1S2NUX5_9ACTN|nr:type I polyketide synthase [Streptomyces colonosanans]OIJ85280.1 type I polyketide synthase [Streptomyces colonosanans]